jgi:hypothetical protein
MTIAIAAAKSGPLNEEIDHAGPSDSAYELHSPRRSARGAVLIHLDRQPENY